jgi:hypothetical protein
MTLELFYGNIRKAYGCDCIWLQRLKLQFDIENDGYWHSATLEQHDRSVFYLLSLKFVKSIRSYPLLHFFSEVTWLPPAFIFSTLSTLNIMLSLRIIGTGSAIIER